MTDGNDDATGFEKLRELNDVKDVDADVDRPSEEELEEMSMAELREEYGPFADLYLRDENDADESRR